MIQRLREQLDVAYLSVGSEYFINSQELEDKVRNLLPSQGGAGAGFDLSASTQIVPIIDLTESAEGSNVRADLQRSFSFSSLTSTFTNNTTATIINNTGYFRIIGTNYIDGAANSEIRLKDATSSKILLRFFGQAGSNVTNLIDIEVFLKAGDSVECFSSGTGNSLALSSRQIADVDGNLVNP